MKTTWIASLGVALVLLALPTASRADSATDCLTSDDQDRRIAACTEVIDRNELTGADLAVIRAARGVAYSLRGDYARAIADHDMAIGLRPDFAAAYNGRAWSNFRWGRLQQALPDVEKAIELDPASPYSYDTRAHVRQKLGDAAAAMRDYDRVLFYGGAPMTKVYQCGLAALGRYNGERDGTPRPEFLRALEACVATIDCDPLPPDEKCP